MPYPPIRAITLGISEAHPLKEQQIQRAAALVRRIGQQFQEQGYTVQTLRFSTRPLFDDLTGWSIAQIQAYAQELQRLLEKEGIEYCSIGPLRAEEAATASFDTLADMLITTTALSATVLVERELSYQAAMLTAHVMRRLALETDEGFGNFRFALLACVKPGGPFFPAAYHAGPTNITLGVQGAGLVRDAIKRAQAETKGVLTPVQITELVRNSCYAAAAPMVTLGQELAQEAGVRFGGIDLSPAPMADESIAEAIEACGYGELGSAGSLAVTAAMTTALQSIELPLCGYNGLMLPVLEDTLLGRRWSERKVHLHSLLLYSSVCGTGLDTVPLPGDCTQEEIAHILLDVAALALRWRKQLSARLFPVPGKQRGERACFSSPHLTTALI
ncbi:hypothetical protein EI42_00736 [Thermosporothrix hazakensis]|jgi:uncharacterized protein (UPF0210 family)|uniref:Uncharacterized protein n=2 Tax=Thermosporothrix TaxID=768650 RepID=A0A326UIC5_THEHA|nr:DUF711 family protein [Thermosporothrix hazakensis]PZW36560.1 hypothetical protein EI42_00736 [Thermosporothrix hazakensis]BBH89027.1 UPF0210 protein [Thermosporothrix sp. COM3]GCE47211.1 UPF0210 protein [Thermosporothrix hazakensis]